MILFSVGFAAFSSNFLVTGKGTILESDDAIDSRVPTNDLLFWGQANNKDNTTSILKDKSNKGNDGVLTNFDNTTSSGYNDDTLEFDGVNDYVDIGLANYDFNNSISYVIYVKINTSASYYSVFGNWEGAGGGLEIKKEVFYHVEYDGSKYYRVSANYEINKYNTVIGTYDGSSLKIYLNGELADSTSQSALKISPVDVFIGANPQASGNHSSFAHMSVKEAMLYDRALTSDEVKALSTGFQRKYN